MMNNENYFVKNFRESLGGLQSPRILTKEERQNPTFVGTKGQTDDNYGSQQNLVGGAALAALGTFLNPAVLPALLAGAVTFTTKEGQKEPVTIIDRVKVQKNFEELPKMQSLPTPDEIQNNRWIELPSLNNPTDFNKIRREKL